MQIPKSLMMMMILGTLGAFVLQGSLRSEEKPVVFTIGRVTYSFSRNYFINPSFSSGTYVLAIIQVDYMTFDPAGTDKPCFSQGTVPSCRAVTFTIASPRPEDTAASILETERNKLPMTLIDRTKDGFQAYQIGSSPTKVFTKIIKAKEYSFICNYDDIQGSKAVCVARILAKSRASIQFQFPLALLSQAPTIQDGIIELVDNHTCEGARENDKLCS